MEDDTLIDFVYPETVGEGTWIYVIDSGVALNVENVSRLQVVRVKYG